MLTVRRFLLPILLSVTVMALSQSRYTFVFLHKKEDAEKVSKTVTDSLMKGHMANMERLAKEGKLLAAGPFHGGGGIFIFNTQNIEEAQEWLRSDPGVQARRWNVELQPYTPRFGGVCSVGEGYEMVTYSFVRFSAVVSKFNAGTYTELMRAHDEYLKDIIATGNAVTEGVFGANEGGILVLKGEVQPEVFEADPGVQEGLIELSMKKLYIARGSFCEQ